MLLAHLRSLKQWRRSKHWRCRRTGPRRRFPPPPRRQRWPLRATGLARGGFRHGESLLLGSRFRMWNNIRFAPITGLQRLTPTIAMQARMVRLHPPGVLVRVPPPPHRDAGALVQVPPPAPQFRPLEHGAPSRRCCRLLLLFRIDLQQGAGMHLLMPFTIASL